MTSRNAFAKCQKKFKISKKFQNFAKKFKFLAEKLNKLI